MDTAAITTIVSGFTEDLGDIVVANAPAVLTFAAGFIVLSLLLRVVRRFVRL